MSSPSHLQLRLHRVAPSYYEDDGLDDNGRPRIRRARLTQDQTEVLNAVFEQDNAPSMETRTRLANDLGMEIKQISSWFQNKRQKLKNSAFSESPTHYLSFSPTTTITTNNSLTILNDDAMPRNPTATHHTSTFQVPVGVVPYGAAAIPYNGRVTTKEEPFDDAYLRGSPDPSDVSSTEHVVQHPARTSTRARSARLATSPIPTTGPSHRRTHSNTSTLSSPNRSTSRARMSEPQRAYLKQEFAINPQPSMEARQQIAAKIGLTTAKVTNWFRNLRQSIRKGKMDEGQLAQQRRTVEAESDDEETDEDETVVVTPNQSPYSKLEHTFTSTSPSIKPRSLVVDAARYEDAMLLLHFFTHCNLKGKSA